MTTTMMMMKMTTTRRQYRKVGGKCRQIEAHPAVGFAVTVVVQKTVQGGTKQYALAFHQHESQKANFIPRFRVKSTPHNFLIFSLKAFSNRNKQDQLCLAPCLQASIQFLSVLPHTFFSSHLSLALSLSHFSQKHPLLRISYYSDPKSASAFSFLSCLKVIISSFLFIFLNYTEEVLEEFLLLLSFIFALLIPMQAYPISMCISLHGLALAVVYLLDIIAEKFPAQHIHMGTRSNKC